MNSFLCIHSSNRLEALFGAFKQNFVLNSAPFTKRLVVVPSPMMRSWLLKEMAKDPDLSIAMGLEATYLNQAISRLSKMDNQVFPGHLEMAFAIENELKKVLSTDPEEVWEPLLLYLQTSSGLKKARRIASLADELSKVFLQYGIYASKMLDDWRCGKTVHWQQALYVRLMEKHPQWIEPCRALSTISPPGGDMRLHLFGLNFLSRVHHEFLKQVSETIPVHYYLLSPCEMFWGDIASSSELSAMRKKWNRENISPETQDELEAYLLDRNVLLANMSRLGRKMIAQIEDGIAREMTHYEEPGEDTLLSSVQSDLLHLSNHEEAREAREASSIQVHAAPSRFREIQIVFQTILRFIDQKGFVPSDFIVMAPDIRIYAPYIKAVFNDSDTPLNTQIFDLQVSSQSPLVQSYMSLLGIADSRFESKALLQFLESREVMRRHALSPGDLQLLKKWVLDLQITWGEDVAHRNELLKKGGCKNTLSPKERKGTWEQGIKRLLYGLMMSIEEEEDYPGESLPYPSVSLSESVLVEKAALLLGSLRDDLKPLTENHSLTLREWSAYLRFLYEAYFSIDKSDDGALEEEEGLLSLLDRFGKAAVHFNDDDKVCWTSVKHHLNKIFQEPSLNVRERSLQAVKFCSMLPMRAIPAKAIVLMGMDEESFPKRDRPSPLDMSRNAPDADYCPTSVDFDRTLFLEALLSARDSLLITYTDSGEGAPSLLVSELMDYLDDHFEIKGKKPSEECLIKHPFDSFDPRYFQGPEGRLISYSQQDYGCCLSRQHKKRDKTPFVSKFTLSELQDSGETALIRLKDLFGFAKQPMKPFFNNLGIYLRDEEELAEEDLFDLTNLEKHKIKMDALNLPFDKAVLMAEKQGILPPGLLKEVACRKLQGDIEEIKEFLGSKRIGQGNFFSIRFSDGVDAPAYDPPVWTVPAIQRPRAVLHGKFDSLTREGLVVNSSDSLADLIICWPKIVLLNCAAEILKDKIAVKKEIHLLKKRKTLTASIEDPFLWLDRYIDFYLYCTHNISPLFPKLLEDRNKKNGDPDKTLPEAYDKYLLFGMRERANLKRQPLNKWEQKFAEAVDLKHEFFGSK